MQAHPTPVLHPLHSPGNNTTATVPYSFWRVVPSTLIEGTIPGQMRQAQRPLLSAKRHVPRVAGECFERGKDEHDAEEWTIQTTASKKNRHLYIPNVEAASEPTLGATMMPLVSQSIGLSYGHTPK